jgi:hypothetical protein
MKEMKFFYNLWFCSLILLGCNLDKKEIVSQPKKNRDESLVKRKSIYKNEVLDTIYVSSFRELVSKVKNNTVIFIKDGVYEVPDSIYSNNSQFNVEKGQFGMFILKNIKLIGEGNCVFKGKKDVRFPFSFEQVNNLEIRNIEFSYDLKGMNSTDFNNILHFGSCNTVELLNCTFEGITGIDFNKCSNIKFNKVKFINSTSKLIELINTRKINIIDSHFENNHSLSSIIDVIGESDSLFIENSKFINNAGLIYEDDGIACFINESYNSKKQINIFECEFLDNSNLLNCTNN